jgi:hypothetical protein
MKFKLILPLILTMISTSYASNSEIDNKIDVDKLFRNVNLIKLIDTEKARNLHAQMQNPKKSTRFINELDEYIVVGFKLLPTEKTTIVKFNKKYEDVKHAIYYESWWGVDEFNPKEIPTTTLQQGWDNAQACMAQQGDPIPKEMKRVVIYKTLNTANMVYDYVFEDPNSMSGVCREVLYTPVQKNVPKEQCERGILAPCHFDMKNPSAK